ncbi:uncharacterized protein FJT64_001262 [Amphibalanus amphitrite]|uniref:RNA-directed DNA polymerase n=1 Tax=Amphibalanus amphitrite TaxID=1232801 RepID=A0A6A4VH16_AMPAM|nr:uncharacterized protein FJT64_001262 [Amphibalanus amphitrite]
MWLSLWLSAALVVISVCQKPSSPNSPVILEPFEPEPRVFSVLDLLSAINSRLKKQEDQLSELSEGLTELRRHLPEYPGCEPVTVGDHQYRLVGDPDCRRGRLQWRLRGYYRWWLMCDTTEVTQLDAEVVCRSLDFSVVSPGVEGGLLGSTDGDRVRSMPLRCSGKENHLRECYTQGAETRHREPQDEKGLRAFLGATGYHARFMPRYSDLVEPLRAALRADKFEWSPALSSAVQRVKDAIPLTVAAAISEEELSDASAADECLSVVRGYVSGQWPRQRDVDPRAAGFFQVRDELSVHGQLLLRGDRLVVPAALRERVLTNAHAGHQGVVRTKQRLRERFWWPRLDRQVRDLLKSCEVCSQHDGHVRRERPPLQPIPLPDGPWQRLMVDVIGPMRGPSSERYGIVLVDMYSRWPEVALCQDATADSICQFLETVFAREEE